MGNRLVVRRAARGDIESIAAIAASGIISWSRDAVAASLSAPYVCFVAELNHEVIGFIAGIIAADELQIVNIVVSPERRRNGVASDLLRAAAREASDKRAERCYLEIGVTNRPAVDFYVKKGFVTVGTRPVFYADGSDALIMLQNIDQLAPNKD
jgi:ribosomal-protein-alanine acetyltransferase